MSFMIASSRQSLRTASLAAKSGVRFQSTESVSKNFESFLERISAIREASVQKQSNNTPSSNNRSNRSNARPRDSRPSQSGSRAAPEDLSASNNRPQRQNNQRQGGDQRPRDQRPRDQQQRNQQQRNMPQRDQQQRSMQPRQVELKFRKADPRNPGSKLKDFESEDVSSLISNGSSGERSDLHVSSVGGVLFKKRSPSSTGFRQNSRKPNTGGYRARGGKPVSRKPGPRKSADKAKPARALKELSPQEAFLTMKGTIVDSSTGIHITVNPISPSTLGPYMPGTGVTTQSRVWSAIQRAADESPKVPAEEKKAFLADIVNTTVKGSFDGYQLTANNQEVSNILNSNPSLSLETKNLLFNLVSGKADVGSLRK